MRKGISALCLMGLLGTTLYAQNPINRREQNQKDRIRQGIKSGELTRNEAKRLIKEEGRIEKTEAKAKRDGELTAQERRKLDRQLDKASRDIYKEKHDKQDR